MANRNFRSQFSYSYSAKPVKLRAAVAIGASGAPTIQANTGMAIKSMVRVSAGLYDITLSDSYASLLDVSMAIQSGSSAPAAPSLNIVSDAVAVLAAPVLRIQMRNLSGAATDPASGELLHLTIELHDSSTGY